ncbi:MAG: hypothetical protein WCF18_05540, partial [Chthoniobacteraceae bacterium]
MTVPSLPSRRVEVLEARIAPAVFLVSSVDLKVLDFTAAVPVDAMTPASNETTANTNAGSAVAFLMNAGDELRWDANHNFLVDASDPVMVQVTTSKAMVFLTDRDSDGSFQLDDLTGLAVGNGFVGTVKTDVNGTIGTYLDGTDNVLLTGGRWTLQPSSIAGLTISGAVSGNILAGEDISNLTVGKSMFSINSDQSVRRIGTGTSADINNILLGTTAHNTNTYVPTGAGGDITNLVLARNAGTIATGNGAANAAGNGFDGGLVRNVTVADDWSGLNIQTGNGGASSGANGNGGAGGLIETVKITGV